jgi:hypothetical protein
VGGSRFRATFKLKANQPVHASEIRRLLTRVRRDVLPEPLGPINRMDGNVMRPLLRKTTEWRKMGIVIARRIAIARPSGEGFSNTWTRPSMAAIMSVLYCEGAAGQSR